MSKRTKRPSTLEPPKRDYAPRKGAKPSLWQRMFAKHSGRPQHNANGERNAEAKGAGDRAGPEQIDNRSRRGVLSALAGVATAPAALASASAAALTAYPFCSIGMAAAQATNDIQRARQQAAYAEQARRQIENRFAARTVVTTMSAPVATYQYDYLEVPAVDLPDGVSAGQTIQRRDGNWLVLGGSFDDKRQTFMLRAKPVI